MAAPTPNWACAHCSYKYTDDALQACYLCGGPRNGDLLPAAFAQAVSVTPAAQPQVSMVPPSPAPQEPASPADPVAAQPTGSEAGGLQVQEPAPVTTGPWACLVCNNAKNDPDRKACATCNLPRGAEVSEVAEAGESLSSDEGPDSEPAPAPPPQLEAAAVEPDTSGAPTAAVTTGSSSSAGSKESSVPPEAEPAAKPAPEKPKRRKRKKRKKPEIIYNLDPGANKEQSAKSKYCGQFRCPRCGRPMKHEHKFCDHVAKCTRKGRYKCNKCGGLFKGTKVRNSHQKRCDGVWKPPQMGKTKIGVRRVERLIPIGGVEVAEAPPAKRVNPPSEAKINPAVDDEAKAKFGFTREPFVPPEKPPALPPSFRSILITGASGSGKTSLLRVFGEVKNTGHKLWHRDKAVIHPDHFGTNRSSAISCLSSVGLSSVPSWCKSFGILSTGEKYRAEMARMIYDKRPEEPAIMDEFTSELDRDVGKSAACCIAKHLNRLAASPQEADSPGWMFASCNFDIATWLQPEWLCHCAKGMKPRLWRNVNFGTKPRVRIAVDSGQQGWDPTRFFTSSEVPIGVKYPGLLVDEEGVVRPEKDGSAVFMKMRGGKAEKQVREGTLIMTNRVEMDENVSEVNKLFDVPFTGVNKFQLPFFPEPEVPISFRVGVIWGPSGSGKSTTSKLYFGTPTEVHWDEKRSVISHFASLEDAEEKLDVACLDLEVAYRPVCVLSRGERMRADIARLLGTDGVVFDEFTSVLDRPTARRMAGKMTAYIDKHNLRNLVLVGCHMDYIGKGLLEADWVFEARTGLFVRFTYPDDASRPSSRPRSRMPSRVASTLVSVQTSPRGKASRPREERADSSAPQSPMSVERGVSAPEDPATGDSEEKTLDNPMSPTPPGSKRPRSEAPRNDPERIRSPEAKKRRLSPAGVELRDGVYHIEEFTDEIGCFVPDGARIALQPPDVEIEMVRCSAEVWKQFRMHHYKDHMIHPACSKMCFCGLYNDRPIVMTCVLPSPGAYLKSLASAAYLPKKCTYRDIQSYREHRTVVLPDFQGLGIGPRFSDAVGYFFSKIRRKCFYSKSVHPRFGAYRDRSKYWAPNGTNHQIQNGRHVFSHCWLGPKDEAEIRELAETRFFDKSEDFKWLAKRLRDKY